jgi:hypothetical protein
MLNFLCQIKWHIVTIMFVAYLVRNLEYKYFMPEYKTSRARIFHFHRCDNLKTAIKWLSQHPPPLRNSHRNGNTSIEIERPLVRFASERSLVRLSSASLTRQIRESRCRGPQNVNLIKTIESQNSEALCQCQDSPPSVWEQSAPLLSIYTWLLYELQLWPQWSNCSQEAICKKTISFKLLFLLNRIT